MKYLVIDIGGTFTKYAVMDENAAFYEKGKIPTAKESEEGFLHMIEELYERYRDDAEGIAIVRPALSTENGDLCARQDQSSVCMILTLSRYWKAV